MPVRPDGGGRTAIVRAGLQRHRRATHLSTATGAKNRDDGGNRRGEETGEQDVPPDLGKTDRVGGHASDRVPDSGSHAEREKRLETDSPAADRTEDKVPYHQPGDSADYRNRSYSFHRRNRTAERGLYQPHPPGADSVGKRSGTDARRDARTEGPARDVTYFLYSLCTNHQS